MCPEPITPDAPTPPPSDAPPAAPVDAPPAAPSAPAAPPAPPAAPKDSRSVEARLEGMETAVGNLVETLTGILGAVTSEPEHKPVKKPWTHWGTK